MSEVSVDSLKDNWESFQEVFQEEVTCKRKEGCVEWKRSEKA